MNAPNSTRPELPPTLCKYEELSQILRKKVETQASGSRLPSVRGLMKRYKVSLQTVNSALQKLEEENLIVSKRGSGIYVSDHRMKKLIILHRSYHPSMYEDLKEVCLRSAVAEQGWHLSVRRHETDVDSDAALNPEPKACAHVIAQDIANMQFSFLPQLTQQKVPIILMDREAGGFPFDCVTENGRQVFALLMKHLRSMGHTKIAFLVNEPRYVEIEERIRLFNETAELLDLEQVFIVDCHTQPGESSYLGAWSGMKRYLEEVPKLPFTAMIVSSAAGFAAVRALHEKDFEVPKDCCVACFGYQPHNALYIPSITDAGSRTEMWAEKIVQTLRQRFGGDESPWRTVTMPVELTVRESTSWQLAEMAH